MIDDLVAIFEEEARKREGAASEEMREKCHDAIAKVGTYELSEPDEVIIACLEAIMAIKPLNHDSLRRALQDTHNFYRERIKELETKLNDRS